MVIPRGAVDGLQCVIVVFPGHTNLLSSCSSSSPSSSTPLELVRTKFLLSMTVY